MIIAGEEDCLPCPFVRSWKGYEYCRLDGATLGAERQTRIDEFNSNGNNTSSVIDT